jgi:hypothetical protein
MGHDTRCALGNTPFALLTPTLTELARKLGLGRGHHHRTRPGARGTRWVHIRSAARGAQRAPAVTTGCEEPQVNDRMWPSTGRPVGGGPEFESPHSPQLRSRYPRLSSAAKRGQGPLLPQRAALALRPACSRPMSHAGVFELCREPTWMLISRAPK